MSVAGIMNDAAASAPRSGYGRLHLPLTCSASQAAVWLPTSPVGHLGAQMRSRRAGLVLPSLLRGYMEVRLSTRETGGSETCKPEGRTDAAAAPPPRNLSFPVSLRSSAAGAPLLPWITSTVCTAFRGSGTSGGAFTENYTNECQSNRNSSPSTN